jgi:hypothetical protein
MGASRIVRIGLMDGSRACPAPGRPHVSLTHSWAGQRPRHQASGGTWPRFYHSQPRTAVTSRTQPHMTRAKQDSPPPVCLQVIPEGAVSH